MTFESMTTEEPVEDLGTRARRGLAWSVSQQLALRAASFLSGVVLARILVPEDYGVFTVAMAVMTILVASNDLGIVLGVVRWPGDVDEAAPTANTVAIGSSVILAAIAIAFAGPFTDLMDSPESAPLLRVLALTLVLDGVVAVPTGLMIRAFRQDRLAKAELLSIPVGIGLSIGLALAGAGPWALVAGRLGGTFVTGTMVLLWAPYRPPLGWSRPVLRPLFGFGLPVAGSTLVEEALLNIDYLIVGALLGPTELGLYLLAFNLANWPISMMKEGIRRVSIVSFAELHDDGDELRRRFLRAFGLLVSVALPMAVALSLLAGPLIHVVYGAQWLPSADALTFLAFLGLARITNGFYFDLLVGMSKSKVTLALQLVWLAVLAPALWLATSLVGTIVAPAVAHVLVAFLIVVPLFVRAVHRVGIPVTDLVGTLPRPLVGVAAMAGVMVLARVTLPNDLAVLVLGGGVGAAVYVAIALRRELLDWWGRRRAARDAARSAAVVGDPS